MPANIRKGSYPVVLVVAAVAILSADGHPSSRDNSVERYATRQGNLIRVHPSEVTFQVPATWRQQRLVLSDGTRGPQGCTDFEAEPCDAGDAFVVAPDGSRGGLVWEVSPTEYIEEVRPFEHDRWGVWAGPDPVPYGQPRKCSQESGCCVTQIESSLGTMEAVAFSSRVGSTVVTSSLHPRREKR